MQNKEKSKETTNLYTILCSYDNLLLAFNRDRKKKNKRRYVK